MEIQASNTPLSDWSGDGLAVGLFEDELELTGDLAALDKKLAGNLKEFIEEEEFKGKSNSTAFTRLSSGDSIRKIILVGLGKADSLDAESLRRAAASAGKLAKKQKCKTLGISLPVLHDDTAQTAQAITEGVQLALYQDNHFKSEPEEKETQVETVDLIGLGKEEAAGGIASLQKAFARAGASATVASLWEVPDQSTRFIMESFYRNLKKGLSKSNALQQAKLEYLDSAVHEKLKSPYYWAGFVLYGDDTHFDFATIWYKKPWFLCAMAVSLVAFLSMVYFRKLKLGQPY